MILLLKKKKDRNKRKIKQVSWSDYEKVVIETLCCFGKKIEK